MSDSRPKVMPELPADVLGGCSSPSRCSADFYIVVHDAKGAMKRYRGGMYLDNAIQQAHDALTAGEIWITIKRTQDV